MKDKTINKDIYQYNGCGSVQFADKPWSTISTTRAREKDYWNWCRQGWFSSHIEKYERVPDGGIRNRK